MPKKKVKKVKKDKSAKSNSSDSKPKEPMAPDRIERPPKFGEKLMELLKTHKVDEKELYGRKVATKALDRLTSDEIHDLGIVFDTFDSNEDGYIGPYELRRALKVLGFKISREKAQQLVHESSAKGIWAISFNEFLDLVIEKQGESRDVYQEICNGFKILDKEKKGRLDIEDLITACQENNINLGKQDLKEMIQEADLNGDGTVDKDEFVKIMLKTNLF
ncbi:DgyrCDS8183 [Dimorphilus gyrociliatus]|uniref:DgyrCDS8183 n=1 Tax=Dimorphilus gyrociliatus TaxID=2664684 RepID=A0A7I8VUD8_9ANNE|nr:DgyrCDS8183 [Dimorphilus gyrociliatus]